MELVVVIPAVLASFVLISECSCASSTCFLVVLHLTIRMMTSTVHPNISSTSVDGITVLMMIMVDTGAGWLFNCCCVGKRKTALCYWMSGR